MFSLIVFLLPVVSLLVAYSGILVYYLSMSSDLRWVIYADLSCLLGYLLALPILPVLLFMVLSYVALWRVSLFARLLVFLALLATPFAVIAFFVSGVEGRADYMKMRGGIVGLAYYYIWLLSFYTSIAYLAPLLPTNIVCLEAPERIVSVVYKGRIWDLLTLDLAPVYATIIVSVIAFTVGLIAEIALLYLRVARLKGYDMVLKLLALRILSIGAILAYYNFITVTIGYSMLGRHVEPIPVIPATIMPIVSAIILATPYTIALARIEREVTGSTSLKHIVLSIVTGGILTPLYQARLHKELKTTPTPPKPPRG